MIPSIGRDVKLPRRRASLHDFLGELVGTGIEPTEDNGKCFGVAIVGVVIG